MPKNFVFDTNVLVRAGLNRRSPSFLAFEKANRTGLLCVSDETFAEFEVIYLLPKFEKYASRTRRRWFLNFYRDAALNIPGPIPPVFACRDPKDDKFLALAAAAGADCIVSQDDDLLVLNPFRGIPILTTTAFLTAF